MRTYLLNLWDALRASYWFVPTLFALTVLLLSFVLPYLDGIIDNSNRQLPEWLRTTTTTARATLSAMAGAMLAVTGTVFSITIVTLSLTSQQFGPRLLRRFMYDLVTQVTLGVFLSTGFYSLLLLRVVESQGITTSVPHLSMAVAVALCVSSMAMLIIFIHHIAMLIQAPHVVAAVAEDLNGAIDRLFPEKIGDATDTENRDRKLRKQEDSLGASRFAILSRKAGYIQAVDGESLMSLAGKHDLVIKLIARPGDFLALESPIAEIWCGDEGGLKESDCDELTHLFNESIIAGLRRTPRQDVECAVDELVEVAVRSLSPGINDPFTAINCVDHLSAVLSRLVGRSMPSAYRVDDQDHLRMITRPVCFTDVLNAAFNQIRQYGQDSVAVTIRLLEALARIAEHVQREEDHAALEEHAAMIHRLGQAFSEEHDRREVEERFQRLTQSRD